MFMKNDKEQLLGVKDEETGWWVISELILRSISLLQSGGFMDMFGMMNDMIGNMVRLLFPPLALP